MLVKSYRLEYCLPPHPEATHLRGLAHLEGDIGDLLPHLNTVLRGHLYFREPPSLTIKYQAKLITLYPKEIAINILKDEEEAEEIMAWLQGTINATWEGRSEIVPSFEVAPKPRILEILKLLPRTNCRECGQPTCLVFATRVSAGEVSLEACTCLEAERQTMLRDYLARFQATGASC